LWPGRLPLGKLSILDGDPGLGKSLLALDLCARLSTGRPFPDGRPSPGPAPAIVINGEDGAADTIRPRLQALGADLDRVFVMDRLLGGTRDSLRLPEHARFLGRALQQTGARLLVLDPVMAFLEAAVAIGSDPSVRRALLPLIGLAEEHSAGMLLVRHINKSGGAQAIYRGAGSIGISGACRSSWLVARDPREPARQVLAEVNANLAAPQLSLAYTIEAEETGLATISWLGPSPWSADELLAGAARGAAAARALDRAREFLVTALAGGPRTSRELWDLAQDQHLGRRTLRRAKLNLRIRSVRVWADGKRLSYWLLKGQELPGSIPAEAVPADLEQWLGPLREEFPPSTPLDDL